MPTLAKFRFIDFIAGPFTVTVWNIIICKVRE